MTDAATATATPTVKSIRTKLTARKPTSTPAVPIVTRPGWTEDDEADLRALLARRKAARYRKPSRDVSSQRLQVSDLKPNANTVTASIAALVALKGTITRRELLADMRDTVFPHPKAKPQDEIWCQGYIAGAIRNGFLIIVEEKLEGSAQAGEGAAACK